MKSVGHQNVIPGEGRDDDIHSASGQGAISACGASCVLVLIMGQYAIGAQLVEDGLTWDALAGAKLTLPLLNQGDFLELTFADQAQRLDHQVMA